MKDKTFELKMEARKEALAANPACPSCKMNLQELMEFYGGSIRCSCSFVEKQLGLIKPKKK
jgi:hypothetical protein